MLIASDAATATKKWLRLARHSSKIRYTAKCVFRREDFRRNSVTWNGHLKRARVLHQASLVVVVPLAQFAQNLCTLLKLCHLKRRSTTLIALLAQRVKRRPRPAMPLLMKTKFIAKNALRKEVSPRNRGMWSGKQKSPLDLLSLPNLVVAVSNARCAPRPFTVLNRYRTRKKAYHGECFRCTTCDNKLVPSKAAAYEGSLYCTKCFQEGGFTQKQRNVKWEAKESSGAAVASKFGGGGNSCPLCSKTVYPAETVAYEKKAYHQECFKCSECAKKITPSGCGMFEDTLFCTQCFAKGGYARKQATTHKTGDAPKSYDNRFAKFGGGGNKCVNCDKTVYPAEQLSFEKKIFHIACFKCSHEGCSKGGKPISVNDAQYIIDKDADTLTIFCSKCFGELGLNRA